MGKGVIFMITENTFLADFMFWNYYDAIIIHNNNKQHYIENHDIVVFHVQNTPEEPEPAVNQWWRLSETFLFSQPSSRPDPTRPLNLSVSPSNIPLYSFPSETCVLWLFQPTTALVWNTQSFPFLSIWILSIIPRIARFHSSSNVWSIVGLHYTYPFSVAELMHLFHVLLGSTGCKTKERKEHILHIILCCREMLLAGVQLLNKWPKTLEYLITSRYTFVWCLSKCLAFLRHSINIALHLQSEMLSLVLK